MVKVSVIIPVYQVEPYIERCARSLMEQTLEEIEFIFVNDGTMDKSMVVLESILNKYPHRKPMVQIINHQRNLGIHWARKTGVQHALGEYVGFCDSDDWCELNMFEKMYRAAYGQNADIVVNNCFIEHNGCQKKTHYIGSSTPQECLRCYHQKERMATAFWRHLIRRETLPPSYFDRVLPVDLGEDLFVLILVYYYARSITAVPDCLYHYQLRPDSLSGSPNHSKEMLEKQLKNISMISSLIHIE